MFNPRSIFLLISLLLVMLLVFDWGNVSKDQKVEVSKSVQEKTDSELFKISNESLEIFVDLEDGSIKEAFLKEKKINNGLEKVRLLSNDGFLRFYFKSTISGFSPTGFSVLNSSDNYLTIQGVDGVGNVLTKKITFSDKYSLLIEDRLDLSTSTIGVINSFKTFYREEKKFSQDMLLDTMINDGLIDAFNNYHMGVTAENIAQKFDISRHFWLLTFLISLKSILTLCLAFIIFFPTERWMKFYLRSSRPGCALAQSTWACALVRQCWTKKKRSCGEMR